MAVPGIERRLAAILAADVVGYSRLMGADEEDTLRVLHGHRDIINRLISEHHGRIFGTAGDSVIAEFPSAVQAVRCAADIQGAVGRLNDGVAEARRMRFRIGINLGDVMVDGADLLGDGVNVAARIEALAAPGSICVSGAVYEQVKGRGAFGYEALGERQLKNIAEPVRVYRVRTEPEAAGTLVEARPAKPRRGWWLAALAAGLVVMLALGMVGWRYYLEPRLQERAFAEQTALPLADKPSIAVLPFDNLSGDAGQDYFSDGMTENLITNLSKLSGLFVIARNSVFTYRGRPVNVQDVGRELGVRYVLEGSVQKANDRVRIHAQLIDAASGYHLWADSFDRRLEDVFALQDEVTADIVAALEIELSEAERRALAQRYTSSVEAYDEFLKGWAQLFRGTVDANLQARRHFERAIQVDPEFARAYANLALTYTSIQSGILVPDASLETAYQLARTAVTLDDTLPQVHWVLSVVQLYRREYEESLAASNTAIVLEPNFADAYGQQAQILHLRGRPEEGLPLIKHAMRLNPRYPAVYLEELGKIEFALGRDDDAIATLEAARERNPNLWWVRLFLAASYVHAGRVDDAEWEVEELLVANPELSLAGLRDYVPYENPADLERLAAPLRQAGLPE